MIKLATALGSCYLADVAQVDFIGPTKEGTKQYPEPTRMVILRSGQRLYMSDTDENMRLLVPDYVADTPVVKVKKRRGRKPKQKENDNETLADAES